MHALSSSEETYVVVFFVLAWIALHLIEKKLEERRKLHAEHVRLHICADDDALDIIDGAVASKGELDECPRCHEKAPLVVRSEDNWHKTECMGCHFCVMITDRKHEED